MCANKARILVVDDEAFNIEVLVELIKDDYQPIIAKNGKQAIKRANAENLPDLILMANNWGAGGSGAAMVPGPTGLLLLVPGAILLLRRRR